MRLAAAICALLISACNACGEPKPQNPIVEGFAHQAEALELLDLVNARDVSITWMSGDCLEPTSLRGCKTGIAINGCEIYLIKKFSLRISSFVHELVHCKLYRETGDADNGYRHPLWKRVPELKRKLWAWEQCIVWECTEDGGFNGR